MKGCKKKLVPAAAGQAVMLLAPRGYAQTLEQQIEKLNRTVMQLEELVKQQGREIGIQQQMMETLKQDMCSPETAKALTPHLDKHILHEELGVGEQIGNLHIGVGLTGVVQGSNDAEDVSGEGDDQTDASWSMDLEIEAPIGETGLAFMLIEAGQGEGLTDELEGLFHGVNDDAGDSESSLEVTEAWYEHYFCEERVVLTVGKIDLSNYVDGNAVANDETIQFLNTGLVNSLAVEFPEDNGAGVRLGVYPADWIELNFGWAESDADWEDIFNDSFGIAEVNLKPGLLQREGNYRFYVWVNGSDKAELDGPDTDKDGWGLGVSFDQQLADILTVFLRAGYEGGDVYGVEGNWSAGAEVRGAMWNREYDVLGFAVSQAILSDKLDPNDTETLVEIYYSYAVSDQLFISPDIQIIDNPGGDGDNDILAVIGARAQVNF